MILPFKKTRCTSKSTLLILVILSSFLIGGLSQVSLVAASRWNRQWVESKDAVGYYPSFTLDRDGFPHVAYVDITNGALKYASKPGFAWIMKTIETTGSVGPSPSIALDLSGYPHISYHDEATRRLKYAQWNGSAWKIEAVDSSGDVGEYSSLALNATTGERHVSYYDSTNGDLKYAYWNGQIWKTQVVDSTGNVGSNTSISLDQLGKPRICYDSISANTVKLASWNGASWEIETISQAPSSQGSLSIDRDNKVYMSYYVPFTLASTYRAGLNFIEKTGPIWSSPVTIDGGGWKGISSSLKIDSKTNRVCISYYSQATGDLSYAVRNGSEWTKSAIDSGGMDMADVGAFSSLALDSSGNPRVAYLDLTNGALKFWNQTGSAQSSVVVDNGGVGAAPSLALDQDGEPRISYIDSSHGALKYAEKTTSGWNEVTIDTVGDLGVGTSLVLDSTGNPHIAYYDRFVNGDLKYAFRTGAHWEITTIDFQGNVGGYASIKLDQTGKPLISYSDSTNGDLKLAAYDGSQWILSTVDSVDIVGVGSSLARNFVANSWGISYFDLTNHNLKYATSNGSSWNIEVVDSVGNVGQGQTTFLAIDPNSGYPQICYYQATNQDLKLAKWDGLQWVIQTVDSTGNVGSFSSLALDSSGKPRISFSDSTNGNLKYASWDGSNWSVENVDSVFNVGQHSSLRLDTLGNPHISYADTTAGALRYAELASAKANQTRVYVGIDVAHNSPSEFKRIMDDTSDYTNLLVVGYPLSTTRLNEVCQDVVNQGSSFIILGGLDDYYGWASSAAQTWRNSFVASYVNDEVGGETMDGWVWVINPVSYADAANQFLGKIGGIVSGAKANLNIPAITSDYALYWYDYKAGYDTVLAQFGWNNSRQLNIALCRGAAAIQHKDWGAMITWTYTQPPFLESGSELYQDLVVAYDNGAKYITIFDSDLEYFHTTLKQEHLVALQQFWQYSLDNFPKSPPQNQRVAFVLPKDYGLSFRWKNEKIWGQFDHDIVSERLYDTVFSLLQQYGNRLDIIYDDGLLPGNNGYSQLIYWNDPNLFPSATSTQSSSPATSPTSTNVPGQSPVTPTSTPNLTSPLTPTATPTTLPSVNQTQAPEPSPSIPEFPSITILPITIAVTTLVFVVIKRRNRRAIDGS